jgi:hypothetical protein
MDWNELIRIWGAGHPEEELEVESAVEDARRARARRRTRMMRAESPMVPADGADQGRGEEARA